MFRDDAFTESGIFHSKHASHKQTVGVYVVVNNLHSANGYGESSSGRYYVQLSTGTDAVKPKNVSCSKNKRRGWGTDALPISDGCKDAAYGRSDEIDLADAKAIDVSSRNSRHTIGWCKCS